TKLPWGLEIDPAHYGNAVYPAGTTFHPTFLYELLWNLFAAVLLIWIGRRFAIRPPGLFALYVSLYCFGRSGVDLPRIAPRHHIAGRRPTDWVAPFGFSAGLIGLRRTQRRGAATPRSNPGLPLWIRRRRAPRGAPPAAMTVPKGRVRRGR